ncbi:hypothetical protein [Paenibacillus amylolyticus]|uniref:hypothetical protein n=1 Tax=Paenibacillus amylolyticus TaxID=1451 RepID=UPI003D95BFBB
MRSNYRSYDDPEPCPYCGDDCHADFVDVGVGMVQCGPYHCESCGASEIGPELSDWYVGERDEYGRVINPERKDGVPILRDGHPFSEVELEKGWYDPNKKKISPYANTINGVLVDHKTAKTAYDLGILDEKNLF